VLKGPLDFKVTSVHWVDRVSKDHRVLSVFKVMSVFVVHKVKMDHKVLPAYRVK
jgi:hypothetical protein